MRMNDVLNGWPHDHGPTNVGAMVKKEYPNGKKNLGLGQSPSTEARRRPA